VKPLKPPRRPSHFEPWIEDKDTRVAFLPTGLEFYLNPKKGMSLKPKFDIGLYELEDIYVTKNPVTNVNVKLTGKKFKEAIEESYIMLKEFKFEMEDEQEMQRQYELKGYFIKFIERYFAFIKDYNKQKNFPVSKFLKFFKSKEQASVTKLNRVMKQYPCFLVRLRLVSGAFVASEMSVNSLFLNQFGWSEDSLVSAMYSGKFHCHLMKLPD